MILVADSQVSRLIFENPWPAVIACLAVASILRVVGRRRGESRTLRISWVFLALGVLSYATAALVQTDREAILAETQSLVEAAWPVDEAAWRRLLASNALLLGPDGQPWDELTAEFVASKLEQHRVEETTLRGVDATTGRPGYGVSRMSLSSSVGEGFPMQTDWEVVWQEQADGRWQVLSMKWVSVRNQQPTPGLYR